MAEEILVVYKKDIAEFTLIPSDGGRFELELDGELIFSKLKEERYPSLEEIKEKIESN